MVFAPPAGARECFVFCGKSFTCCNAVHAFIPAYFRSCIIVLFLIFLGLRVQIRAQVPRHAVKFKFALFFCY